MRKEPRNGEIRIDMAQRRRVLAILFALMLPAFALHAGNDWKGTHRAGSKQASTTSSADERYEAASWTAQDGRLYLFGGLRKDPSGNAQYTNNFRRYDPETNSWESLRAYDPDNIGGYYHGVLGELGYGDDRPGARWGSATWTGNDGNLYMFGGKGHVEGDTLGTDPPGYLDDLWKYDVALEKWVWIKGSNLKNQPGVYTDLTDGHPGGRMWSAFCPGPDDTFYLFGGYYLDGSTHCYKNDLWQYCIATNKWSCIFGDSSTNVAGDSSGVNAKPGSRLQASLWQGDGDQVYLFGGMGFDTRGSVSGYLSELWIFDPGTTNNWELLGEADSPYTPNWNTGDAITDHPGARSSCASWKGADGSLFLFGGASNDKYNDLWIYDPSGVGIWTWEKGDAGTNSAGVYPVTIDTTGVQYKPGARLGASYWTDSYGRLYVWGGWGFDDGASSPHEGYLEDMWRLEPVSGTVTVTPSETNAPWTIDGPIGFQGGGGQIFIGTHTFTYAPAGSYTVSGEALAGYTTPQTSTPTSLSDGGSIYFTPSWTASSNGTIDIDVEILPAISAWNAGAWSLIGPSGFTPLASQVGDYNTSSAPPGEYLFTCDPYHQTGTETKAYSTPLYQIGTLAPSGTLTFKPMWREIKWEHIDGSKTIFQTGESARDYRSLSSTWFREGKLYYFGGEDNDGARNSDLMVFDPGNIGTGWQLVHGVTYPCAQGTYGTQGSYNANNSPGARGMAATWVGDNGNLFLFGGWGYGETSDLAAMNDFWELDLSGGATDKQWRWLGGVKLGDDEGQARVVPLSGNIPSARMDAATWKGDDGTFYLFGGNRYRNDMWRYVFGDTPANSRWTLIKGPHGPLGEGARSLSNLNVFSPDYLPLSRRYSGAESWLGIDGSLYLMGGESTETGVISTEEQLRDLWRFDLRTNQWALVHGAAYSALGATYGTRGYPASANHPGAREQHALFTGSNGHFYLFGGLGHVSDSTEGLLNDLWEYNPDMGEYTWLLGSNLVNQSGVYSSFNSIDVTPGARKGALYWTDPSGVLYLYGGEGRDENGDSGRLNDLWKLEVINNEGTIVVDMTPDAIAASFTISGPDGFEGGTFTNGTDFTGGTYTFERSPIGDYDITFGSVTGYTTPASLSNQPLYDGRTLTFSPVWTQGTGTVAVDVTPDNGRWTISGPSGFAGNGVTYTGDVTFTNSPVGTYTVTPQELLGFTAPANEQGTLASGGTLSLSPDWAAHSWVWEDGPSTVNQDGVYVTPGGRMYGASCIDSEGNVFVFGGNNGSNYFHNDLWRYDDAGGCWTLISGDAAVNESGVYSDATASNNKPGGRYAAVIWSVGNSIYLFGGTGYDASSTGYAPLNDLWKFDLSTKIWVKLTGSTANSAQGVFGSKNVPGTNYTPGGRYFLASWQSVNAQSVTELYLFGGIGRDDAGTYGKMNDVWRYNTSTGEWTWLHGSNLVNASENYTVGSSATPGARYGAAVAEASNTEAYIFGGIRTDRYNDLWKYNVATNVWEEVYSNRTSNESGVYSGTMKPGSRHISKGWFVNNKFYLFGGYGYDTNGDTGYLDDVWEYNVSTGLWDWLAGSDEKQADSVYGTRGVEASANTPGARSISAIWSVTRDSTDYLYLFGGYTKDLSLTVGRRNDVWKFNTTTEDWTWMDGPNTRDESGVYEGEPGARKNSVSWSVGDDIYYLGGYGRDCNGNVGSLSDLWKFDTQSEKWLWLKGSKYVNELGDYGTKGTEARSNRPGGRYVCMSFQDSGTLYLFGGYGYPQSGGIGHLNDLWTYNIANNKWKWIKGDNAINTQGVVSATDSLNKPGARYSSTAWVAEGDAYLFGGDGCDTDNGVWGRLSDLWKYDFTTNNWAHVKGSLDQNQTGVYENATPSNNMPGARYNAVGWTHADGGDTKIYLFGGASEYDSTHTFNDLWEYDVSDDIWTWVSGAKTQGDAGTYGDKGTPDSSNTPGARKYSVSWYDETDSVLFLFGGYGYDDTAIGYLNDLWQYDPATSEWTWVSGNDTKNQSSLGTEDVSATSNRISSRYGSTISLDSNGTPFVIGGQGYGSSSSGYLSDVWTYNAPE